MTTTTPPTSDIDLFSDEVLTHTVATFSELRELAPVVFLPNTNAWAITRYEDIRNALADTDTFSSTSIAFNPQMNEVLAGTSLAADPPEHTALRAVISDNLSPRALRAMKSRISVKADNLVSELAEREHFDGMADLGVAFPVSVVLDLIGIQGDLREKILPWGEAAFNLLGPMNQRSEESLPIAGEMFRWTHEEMRGEDLAEGSIGRSIWEAAERGEISHDSFGHIVHQILAAGMESTISTIGNAIVLLAENPDQYAKLRADPSLVPATLTEVLRVYTPVPLFGRGTTRDVEIGGTVIPEGAQVALLYGSGNRDPRKFDKPDSFDISRNAVDHLGFGYGIHSCAGRALAQLEIHGLLEALVKRIKSYDVADVVPRLNNFSRPYDSIAVTNIKAA